MSSETRMPTAEERQRAEETLLQQPDLGTGFCDVITMLVAHERKAIAAAEQARDDAWRQAVETVLRAEGMSQVAADIIAAMRGAG